MENKLRTLEDMGWIQTISGYYHKDVKRWTDDKTYTKTIRVCPSGLVQVGIENTRIRLNPLELYPDEILAVAELVREIKAREADGWR